MNWLSIIALVFSAIGIGISIAALLQSKRAHKAVMRQNWEKELAEIEQELANINIEIAEITSKPHKVYGVVHPMDIEHQKLRALGEKRAALLKRKQQIELQL